MARKTFFYEWDGVLNRRRFGDLERIIKKWTGSLDMEALSKFRASHAEYVRGFIDDEDFWRLSQIDLSLSPAQIDELRLYYTGLDLDEGLWTALPYLRTKYNLGIIADCSPEKTKIIHQNVDLGNFSVGTFFSGYSDGLSTKDQDFFDMALISSGVKPQNCFFVAPPDANFEAAKKVGLHILPFTGYDDFKDQYSHV